MTSVIPTAAKMSETPVTDAQMIISDPITPVRRQIFDVPLAVQRYVWVKDFLANHPHIRTLTDLGCGNGRILQWLKSVGNLNTINLVDNDYITLDCDSNDHLSPNICELIFGRQNSSHPLDVNIFHGDIVIPDDRLHADCITMVEVIEHLTPDYVDKSTRVVFGHYRPKLVVITTPNREFNHLLRGEGEDVSKFRHNDHKFEWTRTEFALWAQEVCRTFNYSFELDGVGQLPGSEPFGPCTQIAIFHKMSDALFGTESNNVNSDCLDMLLEKVNVKENIPEWRVESGYKKVSLISQHSIPGMIADQRRESYGKW